MAFRYFHNYATIYTFVPFLPEVSLMLSILPIHRLRWNLVILFFFSSYSLTQSLLGAGKNGDNIPEGIHHFIAHYSSLDFKGHEFSFLSSFRLFCSSCQSVRMLQLQLLII